FYHGGSRLFEFDQSGKYVRELGQGVYGINAAQELRIDSQDNIWLVDAGSTQVMKFDAEGRTIGLIFSRKPENISGAPRGGGRGGGAGGPGAGGRGGAAAAPGGARGGADAAGGRGGRGAGGGAPAGAPPAAAPQAAGGAGAPAGGRGGRGGAPGAGTE